MVDATKPGLRRATESSRRTPVLRVIDGRSAPAIAIKRCRDVLLSGLLAPINEVAFSLATRYAILQQHLDAMDAIALSGSGLTLTPSQAKVYLALSGQSQRILRQLTGLKATKASSGVSTSMISQLAASA